MTAGRLRAVMGVNQDTKVPAGRISARPTPVRGEEGRTKVMSDKVIENNQVSVIGEIVSGFTFSHEVFGEGFYMVNVLVRRLSDSADVIPVMISERLIDVTEDYTGEYIRVAGQFRSYNRHEEKKNRLVLSVFAREVEFLEEEVESAKTNQIFLDGYICKAPVYRKTPLGREIADLLIAVNRPYGKSDYIPCICWGRNARFASGFEVGGRVQIWGRIQSREYMKNDPKTERPNTSMSMRGMRLSDEGTYETIRPMTTKPIIRKSRSSTRLTSVATSMNSRELVFLDTFILPP